jgi:hypothetical protein
MAAALQGLILCFRTQLDVPTTVTLFTDSTIVYYTIVKGTGLTLRSSPLLQDLYFVMYELMNKAGHGKLADPLTRGVPAN